MSHGYTRGVPVDTDPNLAADSDFLVPSQKAVKAYVDAHSGGGGAGGGETTTTSTGNQAALAHSGNAVIRCNNASLLTIQGIAAGTAGQRLTIISVGAGIVSLAHQNGSASAADRLTNFVTVGVTDLAAGKGKATFVYDATSTTWRLVEHDQGEWIQPAYDSNYFSSSGGGTWTVASGDVESFAYWLKGNTLHFQFVLNTTTTSGTLTYLVIIMPNGYTAKRRGVNAFWRYDGAAGTGLASTFQVLVGETFLRAYYNPTQNNWSAATDNMYLLGTAIVEVQ